MPYATLQDLIDRYGEGAAFAADFDADGTADAAAVDRALEAASALVDTHLAVRWPTPLATVPDLVRDLTVDIAIYKLASPARGLSDETRTRYEDAMALLKRLADGKATLDLPTPPAPSRSRPRLVVAGPDRLFSRDRLKGL